MKKERFNKLKKLLKVGATAQAEKQASENPMKFMKDNKNMSIKGKKGIAV